MQKHYMSSCEEQEHGIERVKIDSRYGYNRVFEISPDDVYGDQIYVLYNVKNNFPRLERIKIRKEKRKMYDRFDPFGVYYHNDFQFHNSHATYLNYAVQLPELIISQRISYDRYSDRGSAINRSEYELRRKITGYERQITYNAMSQINAGDMKLKTLLIDWGDEHIADRNDPISITNELVAYKRLGLILYPCNELTPYIKEDPYLKW